MCYYNLGHDLADNRTTKCFQFDDMNFATLISLIFI